ncbi:MAG: Ribosomal RNA large subunit methyltransferase H [Alphaproteobacteria bacterium ADurb.BinA305]|nr:MAG: Ribosomal RNA large subunit methyltransferase H [Alphaproteobacteria bacterium ADurb.BinA305]
MKLIIVAVGHRMPAWVQAGFDEFARRMPRELQLQLVEVKAEPRSGGKTVEAMMAAEAARIEATLPPRCRRVILDERGADLSTLALARRLESWQGAEAIRLSSLTLPHALVRPLLAEALYRAWTVLKNHPYHRE